MFHYGSDFWLEQRDPSSSQPRPIGVRIEGERMAMPGKTSVVHSDPDILGGAPVFQGTRVPFRNLIDYLKRGYSLEEFLDAFPSVTREQVVASLEAAHEALSVRARSA
jgi:uncharacterized protein (DUF433 family)